MAEQPFRWGILSAANIARKRFVPGVRTGSEGIVAAVAARDLERAQAFACELGIPRAYGSYEELLADPEIDGVYIGLPNSLHTEWTVKAAAAGKHVLCEKPLSRRVSDVEQMIAACEAAGVVLMEAFMYRHHRQHARVRELIASGAIGEPTIVRASFTYAMPDERRAAPTPDVRVQAGLDGGAFMDVGCYALNAARLLFDAEPVEVTAFQRKDPLLGVDTLFAAVVRFPGDRMALIDGSFDTTSTARYEVSGFDGAILVEKAFQPERLPSEITITSRGERRTETVPGADQMGLEADHFARSVRAGRLLAPAENGLAQARALEALYRSAETGQAVRLS
ncbi:MAG: Gfo/Idh/MocA family oxidoreductase [Chloroflexi bacterium]|nr:Gfo/Idh/MocA family oxidoreductase [Chloroflexota bacterium]